MTTTDPPSPLSGPAFGQADLTNCERELIHLAGSIQPHGVLLVLRLPDLSIVQTTANAHAMLGLAPGDLLGGRAARLGGSFEAGVRQAAAATLEDESVPVSCDTEVDGETRRWEGCAHRIGTDHLVVELEPLDDHLWGSIERVGADESRLGADISAALQRFGSAGTIGALADAVVRSVREMAGYDRVMVYKFDPEGHGKIIAEARDPRLESLLGHHYPATDIPQRARELYLRNRVRVLVDVDYSAVPLVPARLPGSGEDLDMSMCTLRSMSPLHLQYLKNMGVTATLVASLVREGRLWGLIAAHHYSPRNVGHALRIACDLLAEVASTRIAAIENYAHAQVAILVRRLEQRLIEATSTEGDWRLALFRHPGTVLRPLEATGAALFHDGEIITAGEVPSSPELRALLAWVDAHYDEPPFACSSVAKAEASLDSLTPTASGVLAVKLSASRPEYLMWFRKEQLLTVTWAGDPTKPMVGDDPLELSPRRSFAAWSEIVRGTAQPWTGVEKALARAFGASLVDIIVQVHAVRLLIADHQLHQTRYTVENSNEPVVVADKSGAVLCANTALLALASRGEDELRTLADFAATFTDPAAARGLLESLRAGAQPWRGELEMLRGDGGTVPVAIRAEVIPGRDGMPLGYMMILADLTGSRRAEAAREHLEQALRLSARAPAKGSAPDPLAASDAVIGAIITNASLAAMDITDGTGGTMAASLLEELENATRRAAKLYGRIRRAPPPAEKA